MPMQIYDLKDSEGRVYAFEVDNLLIGRRGVADIVATIPGAHVSKLHRSWWGPDEFCEFEVAGTRFRAWEPFGDNSRYWIGPEPPHFTEQTAVVRAAFASHTPKTLRTETLPVVKVAVVLGGLGLAAIEYRIGNFGAAIGLVSAAV